MKDLEKYTPIVLAFTPNYFIPAATCIWSILSHTAKTNKFEIICLLTEDLPFELVQKLKDLDIREQVVYKFINLKDELSDVYVDERYTVAASYRLLLPDLLPEYDKVIYTDCDMIIRNDLAELYDTIDLKNNFLGVVHESPLDFQKSNIEKLGCKPGYYFNSGFLVMNLKALREKEMVARFLNGLKCDYLEFPDQDVLNMTCQGNVLALPPYYNSIRTFFLPQYKSAFLEKYTKEDWDTVQSQGNIHYTGGKPWNMFTVMFNVWWNYFWQLPESVRKGYSPNKKMNALYQVYKTNIGRLGIESLREFYRKMR